MDRIICVVGPTASGKTKLAVQLAKLYGGEVVSCDSMQIYKHMDIGTAKPTKEEMEGVHHHLLDMVEPGEDFSAGKYVQLADSCVQDILSRGKTAVIAGGTGLYVDSLIAGRSFAPVLQTGRREALEAQLRETGGEAMLARLREIDPEAAARLHPADEKRVIRALEVYRETGKTMSRHNADTRLVPPRYEPVYLGLAYADREEMKRIIDSGEIGKPLLIKCCHRNVAQGPGFKTENGVTNVAIHELDICRWLLGENLNEVAVRFPRATCFAEGTCQDPQLVLMQSDSGVLIDVEVSGNSYYGYEILCELVCEKGTIRLPVAAEPIVRSYLQCGQAIPEDWTNRFVVAYQEELQHWVDYLQGKTDVPGPGAEDGYEACKISDALIKAQTTGQWEKVEA